MSELRVALRLARREVGRRPGRTTLVAVLVGVPVAFMVLAIVLLRTEDPTQDEAWQRDYGDADAVVDAPGEVDPRVPDGARAVLVHQASLRVRAAGDVHADVEARAFPADDPLMDGLADLVAGRFPTDEGEVALAPDLAGTLGVGVGDRLVIERPTRLSLAVVGLVEMPGHLGRPLALTVPHGPLLDIDPRHPPTMQAYLDLPDAAAADRLRGRQGVLVRGDFIEDAEGMSDVVVIWVYLFGAVVLTVAGIVIAAAFAAGARRQLVVLGQLSANGASGRLLRTTLVLQGTVTGLVGAGAGVALVLGLLIANQSWFEEAVRYRFDHYDIRPADLAGAVIVGVAAASVAALIPAWSVTRISTLAALAGRRPLRPVRRRVTVGGLTAVAIGLGLMALAVVGSRTGEDQGVWAFVAVLGGVLELLGACAVAPAVVARLERLAGHSRGAWRLAARGLARERARTGAVVSAVAAAGGLAVATTALLVGYAAGDAARPQPPERVVVATEISDIGPAKDSGVYAPPDAAARSELERLLPTAERVVLRTAGVQDDWTDLPAPIVADDAMLDGFGVGREVRRALAQSGLVALGSPGDRPAFGTLPDGRPHEVATVASDLSLDPLPGVLISRSLLGEAGLEPHDAAVALVADRPLTPGRLDALETFGEDWQFDGPETNRIVAAPWPHTGPTPLEIEVMFAAIALVFAVLVVGASLALAATESRDERDVLTVAGVAPRSLARSAGGKAWLLAAIGAAMAVPIGLLPVAVFAAADHGVMVFRVPWRTIGLLAVVLPATAAAVALVGSALAQRLRPVRVSTAVFE
jgi:putative ABC transport system permease protein